MLLAETIEAKFTVPERLRGLDGWLEMVQGLFTNYPLLGVLVVLIIIDVFTGILASVIAKNISSVASYRGMLKKGVMLLVVVTARVMEIVVPQAPLMSLGCLGFIAVELASIIENCGKAGMPLPPKLKEAFEKFKETEKFKEKPPTVVEVHMEGSEYQSPTPSKFKRPSDVNLKVKDSGELEIVDEQIHSTVIVKGQKGDKGEKGDKGDSYPPEK
jgi:toxin secretion/phage lysis holin